MIEQAFIGLLGLLIGILLNEYLRRRNRVEVYTAKVFEKRLEVYEGLMKVLTEAEKEANEMINSESIPIEERRERALMACLLVAEYADDHFLYMNDEITVHCGATFVGVGDIINLPKGRKREDLIKQFHRMIGDAKKMIRKESGMSDIDNSFRTVTRAKHSSPVIDYYRKLKAEYEHSKKRTSSK